MSWHPPPPSHRSVKLTFCWQLAFPIKVEYLSTQELGCWRRLTPILVAILATPSLADLSTCSAGICYFKNTMECWIAVPSSSSISGLLLIYCSRFIVHFIGNHYNDFRRILHGSHGLSGRRAHKTKSKGFSWIWLAEMMRTTASDGRIRGLLSVSSYYNSFFASRILYY